MGSIEVYEASISLPVNCHYQGSLSTCVSSFDEVSKVWSHDNRAARLVEINKKVLLSIK